MSLDYLNDSELDSSRYDGSDLTNYPYGKWKNKTTSASNDGSPVAKARVWNDIIGFIQYLLYRNKVTPSGTPDNAVSSDIADALYNRFGVSGFNSYAYGAASKTDTSYPHSAMNAYSVQNDREQGTSYRLTSGITDGGVYFGGALYPGDRPVYTRKEAYDVTGDILFTFTDEGTFRTIRYAPITKVVLTGIPKSARILGISLETRQTGAGSKGCQLAYELDYTVGTWPVLEDAVGLWPSVGAYAGEVSLVVEYDPSDVD